VLDDKSVTLKLLYDHRAPYRVTERSCCFPGGEARQKHLFLKTQFSRRILNYDFKRDFVIVTDMGPALPRAQMGYWQHQAPSAAQWSHRFYCWAFDIDLT